MKTSRAWMQKYFTEPLPEVEAIADALTFHAVEIEEVTPKYLDVNILPDRAAYLLSHRGVALETAAALAIPLAKDPLREPVPEFPTTDALTVDIENAELCSRYIGALVRGVKVGPSPVWLREALESVGQRSINNVVDATNYVMLDIGQPLHAFDADKITARDGVYAISVRGALEEEKITTLSGDEYALPEGVLVITDKNADQAIGIAGVKGGKAAEITESTTDIIIEAANFDGTLVRKTAQALKLWTDASQRFQNRPSPQLASYGMRDVLALITDIAGGELVGVVDVHAPFPEPVPVSVSVSAINAHLGSNYSIIDVRSALERLGFVYSEAEDVVTIIPPFERRDLVLPEDLIEEVGRILGYENIESEELPIPLTAPDQAHFRGIERVKDFLIERGFSELSTPSFATEGDIELANPLQADKPWLRASLLSNLADALTRAAQIAPRTLGPEKLLKLFELGNVFTKDGEVLVLGMGVKALDGKLPEQVLQEYVATLEQDIFATPLSARYSLAGDMVELNLSKANLEKIGDDYAPITMKLGKYRPFSIYPFALRDIAVWTPAGTEETEVQNIILKAGGDFLVRIDLFDRFQKEDRISYAYRLVFESMERTLSDTDIDPVMARITAALNAAEGFEVR